MIAGSSGLSDQNVSLPILSRRKSKKIPSRSEQRSLRPTLSTIVRAWSCRGPTGATSRPSFEESCEASART